MPKGVYKRTEQHLKRMSETRLGNKHSRETKRKMSLMRIGERLGEKNPRWKGGISNLEIRAGRKKPTNCEVCGSSKKISFDHDHKTGQFRGWICHKCNSILGFAGDEPERLEKLADYLREKLTTCLVKG